MLRNSSQSALTGAPTKILGELSELLPETPMVSSWKEVDSNRLAEINVQEIRSACYEDNLL